MVDCAMSPYQTTGSETHCTMRLVSVTQASSNRVLAQHQVYRFLGY